MQKELDIQRRRSALSAEKRALLEKRMSGGNSHSQQQTTRHIVPRPAALREVAPLSFTQLRYWFFDQFEPGTFLYNNFACARLSGKLHLPAFRQVWDAIIQRHEILRTTFTMQDGQPVQVIAPHLPFQLPLIDLSSYPEEFREREVEQRVQAEARKPFDLTRGPLLRLTLYKMAEDEHRLLITIHHIIADGWSIEVLLQELGQFYYSFAYNAPVSLPPLAIQYADFVLWQNDWLQGPILEQQLAYWKKTLDGIPDQLLLPTDHPRPAVQTFRGAMRFFEIPSHLTSALKALCKREGVTPFMALLAILQLLLARYSGQRDIVVGTPTANRTAPDLEPLIGCFINMLALRTDLSGNPTFQSLLQRVRQVALGAYAHQDIPFEKLVEELRPERNLSRNPLFQVMFAYQSFLRSSLSLPDLTITSMKTDAGASLFDLHLTMWDIDDILKCDLAYSTELFEPETIARLQNHFLRLLESVVADPTQHVFDIPLLTPDEQQLLTSWNNTATLAPVISPLHELFEAQVAHAPEATALVAGEIRLSYGELNRRANQLAHYLSKLPLAPGEAVGLYLERSPDLIIGLLAILKAGGMYLPLDIAAPPERIAWMIEDAHLSIILTHSSLQAALPTPLSSALCLDTLWSVLAQEPEEKLPIDTSFPPSARAAAPAYCIYTSGSTGRPKGVFVPHRAVANYVTAFAQHYELGRQDALLQFAAISFDTAAEEIFLALCHGARLILRPAGYAPSLQELLALVTQERISVLDLPTAYWHEWVTALPQHDTDLPSSLRLVIIGGEAASPSHLALWQERVGERIRLVNTYGPTETAIVATTAELTRHAANSTHYVPIGTPIANVRAYVLDSSLQQLPIGIPGELYIAGTGVAWGYLNAPDSTAEKFLPDPFVGTSHGEAGSYSASEPGACLYKTGDLVRYLPDGNLVFLGRLDQQVKIRGYRVELGEIESALRQHAAVEDAVVLTYTATTQSPIDASAVSLVAYIVPHTGQALDSGELKAFLHTRLPAYMLPSTYIPLEKFPLTSHGKVDRRALPPPIPSPSHEERSLPSQQTSTEEVLAVIWSQVLGRSEIGSNENFFEIGGHSLLAMRLMTHIAATFQVELPVRVIFENPTIAALATVIQAATYEQKRGGLPAIVPVSRDLPIPLSSQQQRFWFLSSMSNDRFADPLAIFLKLQGPLDVAALEESLNVLLQRHESLRTTFARRQRQLVQLIAPFERRALPLYDLCELDEAERAPALLRLISELATLPFDLERGPLFRPGLARLAHDEHVFLLCMHHIIIDGWSTTFLRQELFTLYQGFSQGSPISLPPPTLQYADFAVWQAAWLQSDDFARQRAYWIQQLSGLPDALDLPTDYPRPARQTFQGAQISRFLPSALLSSLTTYARSQEATLFMLLLAALDTLLWGYTGQDDIAIGTIIANRNHPQTEQIIGLFINTLVLRSDLSGNPTFQELLQRVRRVTLDAYEHQDMPFEKLVEALKPRRDPSRSPLFQVLVLLQNLPASEVLPGGIAVEPLHIGGSTAIYDLTLYFTETPQGLFTVLEYNTALFAPQTIERLLDHLYRLLEQISASPEAPLSSLILSLAEGALP